MSTHKKRTIKFLANCTDTKLIRLVLKTSSSTSLIKSICNAILNAATGEISISESEKTVFQKHRKSFELLSKKQTLTTIKQYLINPKNKILGVIPVLLTCVLRSIGTTFIIENNGRFQKVRSNQPQRTRETQGEKDQGVQSEC